MAHDKENTPAAGNMNTGRKQQGEALVVECEASAGDGGLQAAFGRFQKARQTQRMEAKRRAQAAADLRRTPEAKAALRAKFVDRALSYIGTPYAQRYHEPGSSLHDAPLFLDCCGLVRRVVRDLSDEFGFTLGGGNQAYQFDTLPRRFASVEELVPGDLVFYQATFKEQPDGKQQKPQKHDMVHVEVYLGNGETVGSLPHTCWRTGGTCGVQKFASYECAETGKWKLDKYWFCSIDTWLEGTCRSCCAEHSWSQWELSDADGRSIFACAHDEAAED